VGSLCADLNNCDGPLRTAGATIMTRQSRHLEKRIDSLA
jgi:hypothetical protein